MTPSTEPTTCQPLCPCPRHDAEEDAIRASLAHDHFCMTCGVDTSTPPVIHGMHCPQFPTFGHAAGDILAAIGTAVGIAVRHLEDQYGPCVGVVTADLHPEYTEPWDVTLAYRHPSGRTHWVTYGMCAPTTDPAAVYGCVVYAD